VRVLYVNKFAFVRGGQEKVVFDEIRGLRTRGHDVELFSTRHEADPGWRYRDQFTPYHELGTNSGWNPAAVLDMFWNRDARVRLRAVLDDFEPDVVHFHGIHRHLTPSVVSEARRFGARTVMTLHDYWPVCCGNVLLRSGRTPCSPRACRRLNGAAVTNRCVQGSVARSALAAAELSWQRMTKAYERRLDVLISPSVFLRDTVREGGFACERFEVVPNAVNAPAGAFEPAETNGVLYAGRLSPEKGLSVLLPAAEEAGIRLVVAGDGPMRDKVASLPFVEYLGMLDAPSLAEARRRTIGAVVPSVWFENAPMAILESMACGRPVVATAIGGIPEIVRDGVDGLLVPPGDVLSLAHALRALVDSPDRTAAMGRSAHLRAVREYSPDQHLRRLEAVYAG